MFNSNLIPWALFLVVVILLNNTASIAIFIFGAGLALFLAACIFAMGRRHRLAMVAVLFLQVFFSVSTANASYMSVGHRPSLEELKSWGAHIGIPWGHGRSNWCALWLNKYLVSNGYKSSGGYHASSFFNYGRAVAQPFPGAIAVNGRHVCLVESVNGGTIQCKGGNQGPYHGGMRSISVDSFSIGTYRYRDPSPMRTGFSWKLSQADIFFDDDPRRGAIHGGHPDGLRHERAPVPGYGREVLDVPGFRPTPDSVMRSGVVPRGYRDVPGYPITDAPGMRVDPAHVPGFGPGAY